MAEHLKVQTDVPELQSKLANYYRNGLEAAGLEQTAAVPRRDMNPAIAERLGIDPTKALTEEQVTHLLTGLRADGAPVPGKQIQKNTEDRTRIAYIDLTFSAPKSFSVALAFAPTEAERAILDRAHRDAVDSTVAEIARHIGVARKGKAGSKGWEPGHIAWVQFDHFTARPTVKEPVTENGVKTTKLITVKVAGDPQRHTHVIIPNAVVTDQGRITSIHQQKVKDRVHEWGSIYQAFLATNLRRSGVEVELDSDTTKSMNQRMARLTSVPRWATDLFSKRTTDGEEAARTYAREHGADWDRLTDKQKITFLKGGTRAARQSKTDDLADYQAWMKQAKDAGYEHRSVLRPGEETYPLRDLTADRLQRAYHVSLPVLQTELEKRSKFEGSLARVAAAKGLIATGILNADEVNEVTRAYRTEGVMQDGYLTPLQWGRVGESQFYSFTTELHVDQEREAISLLKEASENRSGALSRRQIKAAVRRSVVEKKLDFTKDHGKRQLEMIYKLGTSGRAVVGVGVAGAGKSTMLIPLVDAWHAAGKKTIGATLAWRQSRALAEVGVGRRRTSPRRKMEADTSQLEAAGIEKSASYALSYLLKGFEKGFIKADKDTVVIIDEIAQVGTRQVLQLARYQKKLGFSIVGIGDPEQCQAIEAGNTIKLFRQALGEGQIPEILTTVRQDEKRDRITSLKFREGKAEEALARKDEDGTLRIVPGGYRQAIEAAVDIWQQRFADTLGRPGYTVAISAPTNGDARAAGAEIRSRRRAAGLVGPDLVEVDAVDRVGNQYTLPIAVGDRLRLFNKVDNGATGFNGTVVEVLGVEPTKGLIVQASGGKPSKVSWPEIRDRDTGRIKLTYGDTLTIDSRQGDTVHEHITVMPAGSQAVNGYKAYTSDSRHRVRSWIVTSQGAEMDEIQSRRPLGDPRNLENDPAKVKAAIMENMARNLNRKPEKDLATDFIAEAQDVHRGAVRSMQAAWHRAETQRPARPKQAATAKREATMVKPVVEAITKQHEAIERLMSAIQMPILVPSVESTPAPTKAPDPQKQAPASQPRRVERPTMTETEIQAHWAGMLQSIGLRLPGAPVLDGRKHTVPVDGNRGKRKSGWYRSSEDGRWMVAGNSKEGRLEKWRLETGSTMSAEDRARQQERDREARLRQQQEHETRERITADRAQAIWNKAVPASRTHPYLVAKGIQPTGLRQAAPKQTAIYTIDGEDKAIPIEGRLLVPMRDIEGKMWNLQMIKPDGGKLFLQGRKKGLFTTIGGKPADGQPIVLAEGYATAATLRETTALTSVVAFDSGNLSPVARALRERNPDMPIIVAADNDHHSPRRTPPLPNVGLEKATETANEVGGKVLVPTFDASDKGTDFNDYRAKHGHDATRAEIERQLPGVTLPSQPTVSAPTQEDRDLARATAIQSTRRRAPEPAQHAVLKPSQS